jgi:glycerol-3-phosphate dehydrogenase
LKIAIIGGGINGVMTAWELSKDDHDVTLFEKNSIMSATSSASSKLLHGGLRYLENFEFSLVKETLNERYWWLNQATNYVKPIKIFIPVYRDSRRSNFQYKIGLLLYDLFAMKKNIGRHQKYSNSKMRELCPGLKTNNLINGFSYFDAQMDDYKLGLWAVKQAKKNKNLKILEKTPIKKINIDGLVSFNGKTEKFEKIINITGPWAHKFLKDNNIASGYELDLIRGSHIVINRNIDHGYFLEIPNERRIFFVLPHKKKTLIGTTEVRQKNIKKTKASKQEINYLIRAYNHYFVENITSKDIVDTFSGIRPIVKSNKNPSKASREYVFETQKNLVNVFGGKWTTSRQLAKKIVSKLF